MAHLTQVEPSAPSLISPLFSRFQSPAVPEEPLGASGAAAGSRRPGVPVIAASWAATNEEREDGSGRPAGQAPGLHTVAPNKGAPPATSCGSGAVPQLDVHGGDARRLWASAASSPTAAEEKLMKQGWPEVPCLPAMEVRCGMRCEEGELRAPATISHPSYIRSPIPAVRHQHFPAHPGLLGTSLRPHVRRPPGSAPTCDGHSRPPPHQLGGGSSRPATMLGVALRPAQAPSRSICASASHPPSLGGDQWRRARYCPGNTAARPSPTKKKKSNPIQFPNPHRGSLLACSRPDLAGSHAAAGAVYKAIKDRRRRGGSGATPPAEAGPTKPPPAGARWHARARGPRGPADPDSGDCFRPAERAVLAGHRAGAVAVGVLPVPAGGRDPRGRSAKGRRLTGCWASGCTQTRRGGGGCSRHSVATVTDTRPLRRHSVGCDAVLSSPSRSAHSDAASPNRPHRRPRLLSQSLTPPAAPPPIKPLVSSCPRPLQPPHSQHIPSAAAGRRRSRGGWGSAGGVTSADSARAARDRPGGCGCRAKSRQRAATRGSTSPHAQHARTRMHSRRRRPHERRRSPSPATSRHPLARRRAGCNLRINRHGKGFCCRVQ
ncbi:uncharacterized protein LOC112888736 isoform X3 [Panicum hallii]|uniref:uncharacterized protein LOC112888736 isoform X3 n=1 Tax=Panicum hallii TaxID=206008 RepID=UPI000DF4DAEE|nr:uncharacterized protein LOC112888736 isoform X3 [Panicum hallii]